MRIKEYELIKVKAFKRIKMSLDKMLILQKQYELILKLDRMNIPRIDMKRLEIDDLPDSTNDAYLSLDRIELEKEFNWDEIGWNITDKVKEIKMINVWIMYSFVKEMGLPITITDIYLYRYWCLYKYKLEQNQKYPLDINSEDEEVPRIEWSRIKWNKTIVYQRYNEIKRDINEIIMNEGYKYEMNEKVRICKKKYINKMATIIAWGYFKNIIYPYVLLELRDTQQIVLPINYITKKDNNIGFDIINQQGDILLVYKDEEIIFNKEADEIMRKQMGNIEYCEVRDEEIFARVKLDRYIEDDTFGITILPLKNPEILYIPLRLLTSTRKKGMRVLNRKLLLNKVDYDESRQIRLTHRMIKDVITACRNIEELKKNDIEEKDEHKIVEDKNPNIDMIVKDISDYDMINNYRRINKEDIQINHNHVRIGSTTVTVIENQMKKIRYMGYNEEGANQIKVMDTNKMIYLNEKEMSEIQNGKIKIIYIKKWYILKK